mgnify:CR=1 FL=1
MTDHTFSITPKITVGGNKRLLIIAGPCQIESRDHALMIADQLQALTKNLPIDLVFKSSYDKANRTSIQGKRGLGIEKGLKILEEIRNITGLQILTDIHSPEEASIAGEVVDILQTPAFLCRQTDLLLAVGKTGKVVNVKKGQFLAPEDMAHVAAKIASTGNNKVLLCERGACFGYRDLIVDMRSLMIMKKSGYPVIFDATHSVQSMGGSGGSSGGSREFIPGLARAAVACGVDGVFIECHDNPDQAPSDAASMLPLNQVLPLLTDLCKIHGALKG